MTTTTRPLVLTVTQAGNLLGVGRSTAYELVRSGDLESVQLRRRVVVPTAAIAKQLGTTVGEVWLALGDSQPAADANRQLANGEHLGSCDDLPTPQPRESPRDELL